MYRFILVSALATLMLSNSDCGKKETGKSYKGRLEVAGICMNYTISVLEGDIAPELIESNWTDESTGKAYEDVFRLGSPCTFPASIKQGDEFLFVIDTATQQECAVCTAYYPTPVKELKIRIVEK
ncbi:MAG: hypothetical protein JNM88_01255 [Chitinophagaceae bacterium]|nr:hypothetical protein [Chitinophagaceae bacterium]